MKKNKNLKRRVMSSKEKEKKKKVGGSIGKAAVLVFELYRCIL